MIVYNILIIVERLVDLYSLLIFFRCLMTWFPINSGVMASIDSVLGKICDPYLNLFKKFIPPIGGMVDISPIIALLVLQFATRLIIWLCLTFV